MILFFEGRPKNIFAVDAPLSLPENDIEKLSWLFSDASLIRSGTIEGFFVGPRKEMVTPWSTNAVEITQNMGISGISRIEEYFRVTSTDPHHDPMLQSVYNGLDQTLYRIERKPDPVISIDDIKAYNLKEGLALNDEEISYLEELSRFIDRKLTDSEVFGFSQVNSEHCRHKIFNGIFIIDGEERDSTLFQLIKNTTHYNRNKVVSAYKDNCEIGRAHV